MVLGLLDEGDDGGQAVGRLRQLQEARVVPAHGHLGVEVLEQVPGQAQLREDDEVGPLRAGFTEELVVPLQVLVEGAETRRHLRQGDGDVLPSAHVAASALPSRSSPWPVTAAMRS